MKILNFIGYKPKNGSLFTIISKHGSGKTTLLTLIACELAEEGKNVLYLTNDVGASTIRDKVYKILPDPTELMGNIFIEWKYDVDGYLTDFTSQHPIDVIILDGYIGNKTDYSRIAKRLNCTIIKTQNIRENIGTRTTESTIMQTSDVVVLITRKDIPKLSFFQKVIDFISFWKSHIKANTNIEVLKNRYERRTTTDVFIDFKDIELTVIKK